MAPAAAASSAYFATVDADEPGTIQYACGVLATAVNPGSADRRSARRAWQPKWG